MEQPEESRTATAYHEAGHALFCLSQGDVITRVTIIPFERKWMLHGEEQTDQVAGCCFTEETLSLPMDWEYRFEDESEIAATVERIVATRLVGPIAEEFAVGRSARVDDENMVAQTEESDQWEMVQTYLDYRESAVFLAWIERWLKEFLEQYRPALDALAAALSRHGELSGEEVRQVVAAAGDVPRVKLPTWDEVRAVELAAAPDDLEFTWEGMEAVEHRLRLWPQSQQLLDKEIARFLHENERWRARKPADVVNEVVARLLQDRDMERFRNSPGFMVGPRIIGPDAEPDPEP